MSRCRPRLLSLAIFAALIVFASLIYQHQEGNEEYSYRIVILTQNRCASLARLLKSLDATKDVHSDEKLLLEIHIDGLQKKVSEKTRTQARCVQELAKKYSFRHGDKILRTFKTRRGLQRSWLEAWPTAGDKCDPLTVVLEDDLELSPYWLRWLRLMWKSYGDRDDLAGIALNRQQQCAVTGSHGPKCEIANANKPFLTKIVGSWGFSPHPQRWREFISSKNEWVKKDPRIDNLGINYWMDDPASKWSVWTLYYMKWYNKRGLFTLYVTAPGKQALAIHHREKGEHFSETQGARYIPLKEWPEEWNSPSKCLNMFGWDLKKIGEETC